MHDGPPLRGRGYVASWQVGVLDGGQSRVWLCADDHTVPDGRSHCADGRRRADLVAALVERTLAGDDALLIALLAVAGRRHAAGVDAGVACDLRDALRRHAVEAEHREHVG